MYNIIMLNFDKIPTATLQQKKAALVNGHIIMYEPDNVKKAIIEYEWRLKRYRPKVPIEGPLRVEITWMFGTKTKKKHLAPRIERPDLDNMAKLLLDRMTKLGFWKDDSQIVDLTLRKAWGSSSCVSITYEEITNG
ncbi:MAG: RusA family crossover junction endodeoxyribonuclease [Clostridiales bacterium]|nr:RusA family crossover junction endodeoxyribonuclease [Clostridiales bacterium]